MEISKLPENGIRIKSKLAMLGINPVSGKSLIDAAILLDRSLTKKEVISEGDPVIINGPGEYEVKGIKLNAVGKEEAVIYSGKIDNIRICIFKISSLSKTKDALEDCEVVLADADILPDQKIIAGLNPNVVIFYGQHAQESAKVFGKEVSSVSKYSITRDKLPPEGEMEIVVLG